jgi:hypothetical protein
MPTIPSLMFHRVKNLMSQNDVVMNRSPLQKSRLSRRDNLIKKRLKSTRQNFLDNFVIEISKTNRPEVSHQRRIVHLWN